MANFGVITVITQAVVKILLPTLLGTEIRAYISETSIVRRKQMTFASFEECTRQHVVVHFRSLELPRSKQRGEESRQILRSHVDMPIHIIKAALESSNFKVV